MIEEKIVKIHKPFYIDITKFSDKAEFFSIIQQMAFENNWFWNSTGEQNEIHAKCISCFDEVKYMIFGLSSNNTITWAREDYFFNASSLETKGLTEIWHCTNSTDTLFNLLIFLEQGVQNG